MQWFRVAEHILQLALRTRDKRKLQLDEAAQCTASAVCWSGADGRDGNCGSGNRSPEMYRIDVSSDTSRDLHCRCALLAEIGYHISHRRGRFLPAAQIGDYKHRGAATRVQTWRATTRRDGGRMRNH